MIVIKVYLGNLTPRGNKQTIFQLKVIMTKLCFLAVPNSSSGRFSRIFPRRSSNMHPFQFSISLSQYKSGRGGDSEKSARLIDSGSSNMNTKVNALIQIFRDREITRDRHRFAANNNKHTQTTRYDLRQSHER